MQPGACAGARFSAAPQLRSHLLQRLRARVPRVHRPLLLRTRRQVRAYNHQPTDVQASDIPPILQAAHPFPCGGPQLATPATLPPGSRCEPRGPSSAISSSRPPAFSCAPNEVVQVVHCRSVVNYHACLGETISPPLCSRRPGCEHAGAKSSPTRRTMWSPGPTSTSRRPSPRSRTPTASVGSVNCRPACPGHLFFWLFSQRDDRSPASLDLPLASLYAEDFRKKQMKLAVRKVSLPASLGRAEREGAGATPDLSDPGVITRSWCYYAFQGLAELRRARQFCGPTGSPDPDEQSRLDSNCTALLEQKISSFVAAV